MASQFSVDRSSLHELTKPLASEVVWSEIDGLRALGRRARIHDTAQIASLKDSIAEFGFVVPVIVDDLGRVLAGMARIEAAKLLGMSSVPTVCVSHLSPIQKRAFVIAENKLAELAAWDRKVLAEEFRDLIELDPEFDLEVTGFSDIEIETLTLSEPDEDPDQLPATLSSATSGLDDLWILGDHRLRCGDATKPDSFKVLMAGTRARAAFLDPPYNVPIVGHVTKSQQHREFLMGSGELTDGQFVGFLTEALVQVLQALVDGGLAFVCMDNRHSWHLLNAQRNAGMTMLNLCVWTKPVGGQGNFYRSQHELVFVFKAGEAPHLNRIQLGRYGRNRSNVWSYPSVNGLDAASMAEHAQHPTPKPVHLVKDALLDCTDKGDIVLDSFAGGGATLIAAEMIGRRARLMELDPIYCDVIVRRWEAFTGRDALLAETGETFHQRTCGQRAAASAAPSLPQHPPARVRTRATAS